MQQLTLPDDRILCFAEYGDPGGIPVLFCHGLPGSRRQISPRLSEVALALSFRIIAADRPGYGLSSPAASGNYAHWASDAGCLLDHLNVQSCHVIGFSIGAPYALACAVHLTRRIQRLALVSAMAPNVFDADVQPRLPSASRDVFAIARDNPAQLAGVLQSVAADATGLLAVYDGSMSVPDNQLLRQSDISANFLHDCEETLRQGHDAASAELIRYVSPWELDIESLRVPADIWHGAEDINAPPAMADYYAARLPASRLHRVTGEGHLCLMTQWKNILNQLRQA